MEKVNMNSDESLRIILTRLREELQNVPESLAAGRDQLERLVQRYYEIERDHVYETDRQSVQDKVKAWVDDFEREIWGEE
jgi:hypothetical protein